MIPYHLFSIFFPFDPPDADFVMFPSTYFLYNVAYTFSLIFLVSSFPIVLLSIFPKIFFQPTSFLHQLLCLIFPRSPLFLPVRHILSAMSRPWSRTNRLSLSLSPIHPVPSFFPALSILSIQNTLFTVSCLWSCNVFPLVPILVTFPSCHGSLVLHRPHSTF